MTIVSRVSQRNDAAESMQIVWKGTPDRISVDCLDIVQA